MHFSDTGQSDMPRVDSLTCAIPTREISLLTRIGVAQGGQSFKDPNILGHHFHGHYGRPGTDGTPCDPPTTNGTTCFRGDNIFADINPGECVEYEYHIPAVHAPGTFW